MNIHAKPTASPARISDAERQARVDLAAVYRLCAHYGWGDVIYNHCAMRVPGEDGKLLMKRHELLWTEVTAANLVKVDMHEDLDEKAGVNRPGFTLQAACSKGGRTSTARSTCTRNGAWRSPVSSTACAWCPSRRRASTSASAITPTRASPRISPSASASSPSRQEPRADPAQSRPPHRRQDGARGVHPDEISAQRRRDPGPHGGDRRRADRDPAGGLREGRGPIRDPTTAAVARPIGRPICACSTGSTRATATER